MNDLDDDLLKELGLEPSGPKQVEVPSPKKSPEVTPQPKGVEATKQPVTVKKSEVVAPKPAPSKSATAAQKSDSAPLMQGISQAMDVQLIAVVGKKTTTLNELLELREGSVLDLNKLPNDLIDLVANGKLVAKGQLVLIEGRVGVQIKQVYK